MNVEQWDIRKLTPYAGNPRKNDAAVDAVVRSIERFGFRQPIVIDRDGVIVVGHTRFKAAKQLGLKTVPVHVASDMTPEKAREYRIADNATNEIAEWDEDKLAVELGEMPEFDAETFGLDLKALNLGGDDEPMDAEPQIDRGEELNEKWNVKTGDLWLIGDHRLLCGDSTKADDVERVMGEAKAQMIFTDPPYGVDYAGGTKVRKKLVGDNTTALYEPCCLMAAKYSDDSAPLYLWHAGTKGIAAAAAAAAAGYEIRCELVWNKNQAQFGALSAQYKQKHEPCYYCYKRGNVARWFGPANEVTVWDEDRASVNEYHPTQKPVPLACRAIRNSSETGNTVMDLFLGSGTTMVAAQNLGRKCYGIEIAPGYCAVILERMITAFPLLDTHKE